MAHKWSTGLRQYVAHRGSLRECFADSILNVYSGTAPTSPDDAATGTLLCKYTASGAAVTAGDRSEGEHSNIIITVAAVAATFDINVTVPAGGVLTNVTYVVVAADDDLSKVAVKVARALNDAVPQINAVAAGATISGDAGWILIQSRIPGLTHTIAKNGGGGTATYTVTDGALAASVANTLKLGLPVLGVISKDSTQTWQGTTLATGTAGYFRLVTSDDTAALSTTQPRIQGNISTAGAEMDVLNLSFVSGRVRLIDEFELTLEEVQS